MNKIEGAISKIKMEINRLKNNKMCFEAKIEALEELLESLQSIERNKSIPHQEE
jgi:hypothetical protein